jgi:hypothetical protein
MSAQTTRHSFLRKVLLGAGALLLLALGAVVIYAFFYLPLVKLPADLAESTAEAFRSILNVTPRVMIEETVVIEQNTPILELAVSSRSLLVEFSWSHSWLGSTKRLQLRGTFTAKAGFDLRRPFTVHIQRSPLSVTAELPPPELLSLEMDSYTILRDESGWWNTLSDADREDAVRALTRVARDKAQQSGILEEAQASAAARIRELVERNGVPLTIRQGAGRPGEIGEEVHP